MRESAIHMTALRHVIVLTVFLAVPPGAKADEPDAIAARLAEARVKYEDDMSEIRDAVLQALDRHEEKLRTKAQDDALGALAKLKGERDEFLKAGQWPTMVPVKTQRTLAESKLKVLLKDYDRAEKDYLKERKDALAAAIHAECEQLKQEDDTVPWGDNRVAALDVAQRTLAEKGKLEIDGVPDGDYRLEITARRLDAGGGLMIECPLPGDSLLSIPAGGAAGDAVRVMLSVRDSLVSADLGAARPIFMGAAVASDSNKLVVRCDKGRWLIESARFKPIAPRQEPDEPAVAEKPARQPKTVQSARKKTDSEPAVVLQKGQYRGSRWERGANNQVVEEPIHAQIKPLDGNRYDIVVRGKGGAAGTITWTVQLKGNQLVLASNPLWKGDRPPRIYKNCTGRGVVRGETIQFEYGGRIDFFGRNPRKNVGFSGRLTLTAE
ncbi:MAG: hypothetical protein HUU22_08710 [Phycisphaerae bacterium]|nr:hypothetical protein [Phycisphaerae bacterium]NUQ46101.1 hypothetical protein [Phycisphaerae bacterium]